MTLFATFVDQLARGNVFLASYPIVAEAIARDFVRLSRRLQVYYSYTKATERQKHYVAEDFDYATRLARALGFAINFPEPYEERGTLVQLVLRYGNKVQTINVPLHVNMAHEKEPKGDT